MPNSNGKQFDFQAVPSLVETELFTKYRKLGNILSRSEMNDIIIDVGI